VGVDLEAISEYLGARNPDAADRVISSILATIQRARLYPASAPEVDQSSAVPGTRKLVEAQYRYVMYYRVIDRTLVVLRIFHGSQYRG
jgi:plasmid stabilization system protein ParE